MITQCLMTLNRMASTVKVEWPLIKWLNKDDWLSALIHSKLCKETLTSQLHNSSAILSTTRFLVKFTTLTTISSKFRASVRWMEPRMASVDRSLEQVSTLILEVRLKTCLKAISATLKTDSTGSQSWTTVQT